MTCNHDVSKGTYHCVLCHETFGWIGHFDNHQRRYGRVVKCHIMDGLVRDRWGVLRTPEDKAAIEAKVDNMRAKAKGRAK